MDYFVVAQNILEYLQNPYVVVGYIVGYLFSLGGLYLLFETLFGELEKTKAITYSIFLSLVFPVTILVFVLFSGGVAVSHTIKVLLKKET